MERKPIKRNENIIPLSREHHGALLFCWKIRWGIHLNTEPDRISRYVKWFWDNELQPHQEDENKLLFFDTSDELVQRALNEHAKMKSDVADIVSGKLQNVDAFLNLADFLEDHTRYEERVLFPHLEQKLSQEQLNNIGKVLHSGRERTADEDYDDEFWGDRTKK